MLGSRQRMLQRRTSEARYTRANCLLWSGALQVTPPQSRFVATIIGAKQRQEAAADPKLPALVYGFVYLSVSPVLEAHAHL